MSAADAVEVAGVGIHGGTRCRAWLHRAPGPLRFRHQGQETPAHHAHAEAGPGCTVLRTGTARLAVVEHLLAALAVRGVFDGVLVEVEGPELPILDGSAAPWDEALARLAPDAPVRAGWGPSGPVEVRCGEARARVEPGPRELRCEIDFAHPAIGRQAWLGAPGAWRELLPARTFGFAADAARLRRGGRAEGADDGNAIVYDDDGPRTPLRAPDEPVRHKALDALGDLHLLGRPLEARVTIVRGTHRLHAELLDALARTAPPRREAS